MITALPPIAAFRLAAEEAALDEYDYELDLTGRELKALGRADCYMGDIPRYPDNAAYVAGYDNGVWAGEWGQGRQVRPELIADEDI